MAFLKRFPIIHVSLISCLEHVNIPVTVFPLKLKASFFLCRGLQVRSAAAAAAASTSRYLDSKNNQRFLLHEELTDFNLDTANKLRSEADNSNSIKFNNRNFPKKFVDLINKFKNSHYWQATAPASGLRVHTAPAPIKKTVLDSNLDSGLRLAAASHVLRSLAKLAPEIDISIIDKFNSVSDDSMKLTDSTYKFERVLYDSIKHVKPGEPCCLTTLFFGPYGLHTRVSLVRREETGEHLVLKRIRVKTDASNLNMKLVNFNNTTTDTVAVTAPNGSHTKWESDVKLDTQLAIILNEIVAQWRAKSVPLYEIWMEHQEVGSEGGYSIEFSLIMPYYGPSLEEQISSKQSDGDFAELDVQDFIPKLFERIAKTHRRGVVHGNVKPENIVIDTDLDIVRLLDFGESVINSSREYLQSRSYYEDSQSESELRFLLRSVNAAQAESERKYLISNYNYLNTSNRNSISSRNLRQSVNESKLRELITVPPVNTVSHSPGPTEAADVFAAALSVLEILLWTGKLESLRAGQAEILEVMLEADAEKRVTIGKVIEMWKKT